MNLGCGATRLGGYLGVDNNPNAKAADLFHDLDRFPWPFQDSSVDEVLMDHVLEHLDDTLRVVLELYRVSRDGALLTIRTPHYSLNWTHPGHRRAVGVGLFDHFLPTAEERYGQADFEVEAVRLRWIRPRYRRRAAVRLASAAIDALANLQPRLCERLWCYLVGGFEEVEFRVRVRKPPCTATVGTHFHA